MSGLDRLDRLEEVRNRIPRLPNCGRFLACDNTGQWHYLNHANEWVTCPPPFDPFEREQSAQRKDELQTIEYGPTAQSGSRP